MNAREEILRRIRSALVDNPDGRSTELGKNPAIPRDYDHTHDLPDRLGMFVERVEDYKAQVIRTSPDGVAAAVAKSLGTARAVVVPAGFNPAWMPEGFDVVGDEPALSSDELDAVDAVVTSATVGMAVTGTLVLDHTQGQGRRALSLVPDLHVCVITDVQVVGDVPEAVNKLGSSIEEGRPLTWISGPSATSDIELDRVEGVHGPRTLRVVLVETAT